MSDGLTSARARRDRSRRLALEALAELESDLKHIRAALVNGDSATGRYGSAMQRLCEACGAYDAACDVIAAMEATR